MQTTRKLCPIHGIPMGKTVEVSTKPNSDGYERVKKWLRISYHCRVCRAVEERKKVQVPTYRGS